MNFKQCYLLTKISFRFSLHFQMETQFLSKPNFSASFVRKIVPGVGRFRHYDTLAQRQCPVALPGCTRVYSPSSHTWNKALCKHTVRSYVTGSDWSLYIGVKYAYKESLCRASLCKLEWEKMYRSSTGELRHIFIFSFISFLYSLHYIFFHYLFCLLSILVPKNEKRKNETGTRRDFTVNLELLLVCILKMYRQYVNIVM
jgi:hypothetical protein